MRIKLETSEERRFADVAFATFGNNHRAVNALYFFKILNPHLDLSEMLYCLEMAIKHERRLKEKNHCNANTTVQRRGF